MRDINRKNYQRYRLASLLMLVFLLFSIVAHTHAMDVTKSNLEQQECNLCQHSIDKVPQLIKLALIDIGEFNESSSQPIIFYKANRYYLSPQLRAPPTNV